MSRKNLKSILAISKNETFESTLQSCRFHLIDSESTTSPASYTHAPAYMSPCNQISIWYQGGLRFGVFSFSYATCQVLTRLLSLGDISASVKCDLASSKPLHRAHLSLPTWKAGMNNRRSPKSEGVVMHKTVARQQHSAMINRSVHLISPSLVDGSASFPNLKSKPLAHGEAYTGSGVSFCAP